MMNLELDVLKRIRRTSNILAYIFILAPLVMILPGYLSFQASLAGFIVAMAAGIMFMFIWAMAEVAIRAGAEGDNHIDR